MDHTRANYMNNKDLRNTPITAPVHESATPGTEAPRRGRKHRDRSGQFATAPEVAAATQERLAALRREIQEAVGLPLTQVNQLRHELALVLDGIEQCDRLLEGGMFTTKNKPRAAYRTRLFLAQRAATIAQQLGLEAPAAGKQKPWAKMSRAEQEVAAQAALDAVHGGVGFVEPSGARSED